MKKSVLFSEKTSVKTQLFIVLNDSDDHIGVILGICLGFISIAKTNAHNEANDIAATLEQQLSLNQFQWLILEVE